MSRKRDENLKDSILESARRLFAQFGPKKTTVDEIALEAGVGKGTVYCYFEDKEEIFSKVIEAEANELLKRIRETISQYENPVHKLEAFFVERMKSLRELVNLRWLKFSSEATRWKALEKEEEKLSRREQALVEGILKEGKERGLFAFDDAKKLAQNLTEIVTALDQTLSQGVNFNEVKRKINATLEILIEGLRARKVKPGD